MEGVDGEGEDSGGRRRHPVAQICPETVLKSPAMGSLVREQGEVGDDGRWRPTWWPGEDRGVRGEAVREE